MNPSTLTYGADPSGLICGYLIDPATGGRALDCQGAARWLDEISLAQRSAGVSASAGFLWLHFNLTHTGALPWSLSRFR